MRTAQCDMVAFVAVFFALNVQWRAIDIGARTGLRFIRSAALSCATCRFKVFKLQVQITLQDARHVTSTWAIYLHLCKNVLLTSFRVILTTMTCSVQRGPSFLAIVARSATSFLSLDISRVL